MLLKYFAACSVMLLLLSGACAPRALDERALRQYLVDPAHGLSHEHRVGNVAVRLTYRPNDLMAVRPDAGKNEASLGGKSDDATPYADKVYFILSLSDNGQEVENGFVADRASFDKLLQYFNYGIAEGIHLTTQEGQVVPLLGHVYQRMFGSANATTLILVFKKGKWQETGAFTITFNDSRLGTGLHRFTFVSDALRNCPPLAS